MLTRHRAATATNDENAPLMAAGGKKAAGKGLKSRADTAAVTARGALRDVTNVSAHVGAPVAEKGPAASSAASTISTYRAHEHSSDHKVFESSMSGSNTVGATTNVASFDMADADDPLCVVEYIGEIYEHHHANQAKYAPPSNYMQRQPDLNPKMRAILVDWLSEVNDKYRLRSETLYLAVNIIDRFVAQVTVGRRRLQLVGVTGLLLAAKYVEIYPPQVDELVRVSGKAYTRKEILDMEHQMLDVLGFRLSVPTAYTFLIRFLKAAGADAPTAYRARYFCERATLEYSTLKYLPSSIAAASVFIALRCNEGATDSVWTSEMATHTHNDVTTLRPCVAEIAEIVRAAPDSSQQGVRRKYASTRFLRVAMDELPADL